MSETQPGENKSLQPIESFRREVIAQKAQFEMVLPAHIKIDRFIRIALTAVLNHPSFLDAQHRTTLFKELLKCATDGLIPDGREAAILPYKGVPKYLPMVRGLIKKMRNSGAIKSLHPMVVYQNDQFEFWVDEMGPHIKHTPCFDKLPGPVVMTYCVGVTKDEGSFIELITENEMDKIRKASPAGDKGPWGGDFIDEMRKKSVIKRLEKRMPSSTDVEDLLDRDAELTEPHDVRAAAPMKYETIEIAKTEPGPAITSEEKTMIKEATRPASKTVLNHATGKSQSVDTVQAVHSAPKPQATGSAPDRLLLGKQIQAGFQKLGIKPIEAAAWVKEKAGKETPELLTTEMHHLYEIIVEMAIEKGITL